MILPGLAAVPVQAAPQGQEPGPESTPQATPVPSETPSVAELQQTITATITDTLPELTPTVFATVVPTATVTPVETESPTLELTPTPTATATLAPTLPIPTPTVTATATPTPAVLSFTPAADAYLEAAAPNTNYGSATMLQVDLSGLKEFLVKFNVTGVSGRPVVSARLRLYCVNSSNVGGDFHRVADQTWQEGTVTWNNAPTGDAEVLDSLGAVSYNTWYEVDITSLITGDGTYSLRVTSTSSDGADYSSKEGANAPQLIVTTGQGGGLRGPELGKSMRKAGLAKMIAAGGNHAGLALVGEGELTDYLFAGEHFEEQLGLYWVGSRWLDPYLNRWIQPDDIIPDPGNPIDFDRYAYVRNNPLKYVDPDGHTINCPPAGCDQPAFVIDYSDLGLGRFVNSLAMTAIEIVASPVCWFYLGCHIDWGENVITGPTFEESFNSSFTSIGMVSSPWASGLGSIFREFTPSNFRYNLQKLTGLSDDAIKGLQAHHILPQKFRPDFAKLGLNVDDPVFGAWVDSTHQDWTRIYQDEWTNFFDTANKEGTKLTIKKVIAYAKILAEKYKLKWKPPIIKGTE
jgi:RHS repeat-associated protein